MVADSCSIVQVDTVVVIFYCAFFTAPGEAVEHRRGDCESSCLPGPQQNLSPQAGRLPKHHSEGACVCVCVCMGEG